jgi:hypothetical protein
MGLPIGTWSAWATTLEAALERRLDPTIDVCKSIGHLTPLIPQATIDRLRVTVTEPLDDH